LRGLRRSRDRLVWNSKLALQRGWPDRLLYFGIAPGDDLLCTVALRELKKRGCKKIWMMSKNPELFENNRDVDRVVPLDDRFREYVLTLRKKWHHLEYAPKDSEKDMSIPPRHHIIAEMCARAEVKGQIELRPYFHLTDAEKTQGAWAQGMIAVQSSGLAGKWPMKNKQWYPERFQEVVNALNSKFKFVQLGSPSDPALNGVTDLRGKTNLRETAAVLANCRLFLGNVGFLMHLTRAVERPAVIIFGGREAPWQSGYTCNFNLYSAVPCAPCWLWNKCDYNRICMDQITAGHVIQAVEEIAARPPGPLPVDEFTL
jgi:ADP-heptose:LPS heptosyltransferase